VRRRVLGSILGVAVAVVVVFGVPLGIVGTRLVRDEARERLERQADSAAVVIAAARDPLAVPAGDLAPFVSSSTSVDVILPDGSRHHLLGPAGDDGDPEATSEVRPGVVVAARATSSTTGRRILDAWLAVGAGAVLALAVALLLARQQVPRLAGPLQELAAVSGRLGAGDFTARAEPSGIPEIDAVAERLNASTGLLADLLRREREFSANASHQLRTAVTALRLPLEELAVTGGPDTSPSVERALRQADRLERTIEELLAMAREGAAGPLAPYRVGAVVDEAAATWAPILARRGRALVAESDGERLAVGSPTTLAQVLDVLLDNAVRHGAGAVRISVRPPMDPADPADPTDPSDPPAGGGTGGIVVAVDDEGPGIPAGEERAIFQRGHGHGTGLGLAVAREVLAAEGGRLVLARPRPPRFEVVLGAPVR
jgi:signal transduction histidine kinase